MQCGYFQTLVSILILQSVNSANKDGRNQKAEFIGMIEAAKSKMHQVRLTPILFLRWRKWRRESSFCIAAFVSHFLFFSFTVQSASVHSDEVIKGMQKGDQVCDEHSRECESWCLRC